MKKNYIRRTAILSVTVLATLAAGCASVAVSNDAIEQNTASTLGLAKGTFTISDRVNDGVKSSYAVKTNSGKQYSCYVTGTVSVMGRVVSDAVCNEVGKAAKQATRTGSASCNALLKAAGKCQ
jgi:hypothetical protein